MYRRSAVICAVILGITSSPTALAQDTIEVTVNNQTCVLSTQGQQTIQGFWDDIEDQARQARVAELDQQIPNFSQDLQRYDTENAPIARELQEKLTQAGVTESLAELSSKDSEFTQDPNFQTSYNYEQTINAAQSISDDPAGATLEKLQENKRTGLDALRINILSEPENRDRYNSLQQNLKSALESCASEIAPPSQWPWYFGIGLLVAALVGARAWWNSRKPNRHSKSPLSNT